MAAVVLNMGSGPKSSFYLPQLLGGKLMFKELLESISLSFRICKVTKVNLFVSALLMSLDQFGDFAFQELSSALTFIMYFLPKHVLELVWLLKAGVSGIPWLQGPMFGGEKHLSPSQATTAPCEAYKC